MDSPDVFRDIAFLAAELREMRDDCDRVADVLWAVAALLREPDVARPRPHHRPLPPRRSNRVLAALDSRSEDRIRFLNTRACVQRRVVR